VNPRRRDRRTASAPVERFVNLLRLGERIDLSRRVEDASESFRRGLEEGLTSSRWVRDVRA
jgi:hypothetical protein